MKCRYNIYSFYSSETEHYNAIYHLLDIIKKCMINRSK
jgi:hypothetical protein